MSGPQLQTQDSPGLQNSQKIVFLLFGTSTGNHRNHRHRPMPSNEITPADTMGFHASQFLARQACEGTSDCAKIESECFS